MFVTGGEDKTVRVYRVSSRKPLLVRELDGPPIPARVTESYDKCSGSMKITTRLDHISRCKASPGTNRLNGWTKRSVFMNRFGRLQVRRVRASLAAEASFLKEEPLASAV